MNTVAFTFSPGHHALTNIHVHNTMNTKDRNHNIKHITIQHILAPQQGIMHLSPSHSNTKDMLGEY